MLEPAKRLAHATGIRLDAAGTQSFEAHIEFELRTDSIYYHWRAQASDGTWLASFSQPVSLRVVPKDTDPFAYALAHATESMNRYQIRRAHAFRVNDVRWK